MTETKEGLIAHGFLSDDDRRRLRNGVPLSEEEREDVLVKLRHGVRLGIMAGITLEETEAQPQLRVWTVEQKEFFRKVWAEVEAELAAKDGQE